MVRTLRMTLSKVTRALKGHSEPALYGDLGREKLQKMWLVGTLDRLSSMRFILNCPYRLREGCNDLFLCLDPDKLFSSDEELMDVLKSLLRDDTPGGEAISEQEASSIGDLILNFKDDPEAITQIYLRNNEKNLL